MRFLAQILPFSSRNLPLGASRRLEDMKGILYAILAGTVAILMTGCGGDDHNVSNQATVRVVHASPNAPNVDVRFGNSVVFSNVPYFSAGVRTVAAGPTRVRVNAAGTATTVIDTTPTFAANRLYTILAANNLASIAPIVVDDVNAGPGINQARVRFVHGSPTAGTVDIYVSAPGAALPATPTLEDVPFLAVSAPLTVPSGNYQVRITPANTPGTVAIDTGTITLGSNTSTIAVALDAAGGGAPLTARTYSTSY